MALATPNRVTVDNFLRHALRRAECVDDELRRAKAAGGAAKAVASCDEDHCVFHPRMPASLSSGHAGEARSLLAMLAMRRTDDALLEFVLFAVCPFCEKLAVAEAAVRAAKRHAVGHESSDE